jgi:hypothetical protein
MHGVSDNSRGPPFRMKQRGLRPFLLQMARQPCNQSVPWPVSRSNSVQFRRCRRAGPQDCGGRSARNPQEEIVAEISRGARRDRDTHRPGPPPPASALHTARRSRQPRPAPLARISTAYSAKYARPPSRAARDFPFGLLALQVPPPPPRSRQLDPRPDGRGPRVGDGTGRDSDATAASAPAGPVMPAVAIA